MRSVHPLKWYGGKAYLAPWIIQHFPDRAQYTHYHEPFAGGLSVLFAHNPENKSEIINDLNNDLTIFWQVLASEKLSKRFIRIMSCLPLSQPLFDQGKAALSKQLRTCPSDKILLERAAAFFIRYRQSRQGLGRDYCTSTARIRRGMNENVSAWLSAVDGLPEAHARLRRVEIKNMDAVEFIHQYDHDKALFYLDPPYLHETRTTTNAYTHEMSTENHRHLLECLSQIKGLFCLSGYQNSLYNEFARKNHWGISSREIDNKASSKKIKPKKVEVLWRNYQ